MEGRKKTTATSPPIWVEVSRKRAAETLVRRTDMELFKKRMKLWKGSQSQAMNLNVTAHIDQHTKKGNYVMMQQSVVGSSTQSSKSETILVHLSKIPDLIRTLNVVKRSFQQYEKQMNQIPIMKIPPKDIVMQAPEDRENAPEDLQLTVDELDLTAWQSRYRRSMAYIYAEHMIKVLPDTVESLCYGCQTEALGQLDHDLCTMVDEEVQIDICFEEMASKVDNEKANVELFEGLKQIEMVSMNTNQVYLRLEDLLRDPAWVISAKRIMRELLEKKRVSTTIKIENTTA